MIHYVIVATASTEIGSHVRPKEFHNGETKSANAPCRGNPCQHLC